MARRRWGCYSVADHLEDRAFVADLLLYDRLVVPVPAPDDVARWEGRWDPERQSTLLDILGSFAERVEWSTSLREQFGREGSPAYAALDIDDSAFGATRRILAQELRGKELEGGDVRAVAVYAKPDRFDRERQSTPTQPSVRRSVVVGAVGLHLNATPP